MGTPQVADMWADKGKNASKYDIDNSFGNTEVEDCASFIENDMISFLEGCYFRNEDPIVE